MPDVTPIAPKLSKLLPMLATDHDGEVVAAARAISRTLKGAGLDFHDLVKALCEPKVISYTPPPPPAPQKAPETVREIAAWLRTNASHKMQSKERTFVSDMVQRLAMGRRASTKQENWLRNLYYWYGGDVP